MSKGAIIGLSVGVVAVIVIIFIFMGGGWSQAEQDRWTDTCMLLGNAEYCDCTLEYLMDKYPDYSDFVYVPPLCHCQAWWWRAQTHSCGGWRAHVQHERLLRCSVVAS